MNANESDLHMFAAELRGQLAEHGFTVLAVTVDTSADGAFVVYLHGPAGNDHHARAFAFLRQPGEGLDVAVSDLTPAILLVRRRPTARD